MHVLSRIGSAAAVRAPSPSPFVAPTTAIPPRVTRLAAWALAAALLASVPGLSHAQAAVGGLRLAQPWAPQSLPGARNGAAFLTIENPGATPDRVKSATSPASDRVELHTMRLDEQGVMRMREVEAIPVAASDKVTMVPGSGYHLMLMELKRPLRAGETFPLTVVFEKAGPVVLDVVVRERPAAAGTAPRH